MVFPLEMQVDAIEYDYRALNEVKNQKYDNKYISTLPHINDNNPDGQTCEKDYDKLEEIYPIECSSYIFSLILPVNYILSAWHFFY